MYTIFIPKFKGERPENRSGHHASYLTPYIVNRYMKHMRSKENMIIIASPGYISSASTIEAFVNNFDYDLTGNKESILIAIAPGMSGKARYSEELEVIKKCKNIQILSMKFKDSKNHSKMIFFLKRDRNKDKADCAEITHENYCDFLDYTTVTGLLIGSSNQSFNTYYGFDHKGADKGEADVLMFTDGEINGEFYTKLLNELITGTGNNQQSLFSSNDNPGIMLSHSDFIPNMKPNSKSSENDEEYLKEILRKFLEKSLALNEL